MARLSFLLLLVLSTCSQDVEGWVSLPHTVRMPLESALVAKTGEIISRPDFLSSDLVVFKAAPARIQGGCVSSLMDCKPLFVCRPAPGSLPSKFSSLDEVCTREPEDGGENTIPTVREKMGFTLRLNTVDETARFFLAAIEEGPGGTVLVLEYDLLTKEE